MTESRSFAPSQDTAPATLGPPPFPMWPFAITAYAEHCSRDYLDYANRMTRTDDAMTRIAAEEVLSLNLISDINQALCAMVWTSWRAAMGVADRPAPPAP